VSTGEGQLNVHDEVLFIFSEGWSVGISGHITHSHNGSHGGSKNLGVEGEGGFSLAFKVEIGVDLHLMPLLEKSETG
jgi:hypothetical protein